MDTFLRGLLGLLVWGVMSLSGPAMEPAFRVDQPLLFTYGSWDKQVNVVEGALRITATPKGGGGQRFTIPLDHSSGGDLTPRLRVRVRPGNTMRQVRLLLQDDQENMASFAFTLPESGEATVFAVDGASLSAPGAMEKGARLNLAALVQWQLGGDWSSDTPAHLDVLAIDLAAPDATVLLARQARAERDEAERQRRQEERRQLRERYGKRTDASPRLERHFFLGPDQLALEIIAGKVGKGSLVRYEPKPGDTVRDSDNKGKLLVRGGQEVGFLIGPKREWLATRETYTGDPLLDEFASDPTQLRLESRQDPNYATPQAAVAVARKTKPIDAAMPSYEMVLRHRLYLTLPHALKPGATYRLSLGSLNATPEAVEFVYAPEKTWTEAIKVNQIGFRPDDPVKRAFLSLWRGDGGAMTFSAPTFQVINEANGNVAFEGPITLALAAEATERLHLRDENISKTAVYRLDFPTVSARGRYHLYVPGVGISDPFPIGRDVWTKAFTTQMRGLLNNRSGMELGPPFTTFRKPRDLHPADGVSVTQSRYTILDGPGESPKLAEMDTGVPVPGAWGGYHDAGDWNPRRVTHLEVTNAQLHLMRMFPKTFAGLRWNIPRPTKAPDLLNEALWELDCFRRLQKPDGGMPYGIETNGDPYDGEVSWLQSMRLYVFGPDPVSSWHYTVSAALFASVVQPYVPELARTYRESALKAMAYAEREYPKLKSKMDWRAKDARNYAAVALYLLTRDERWHRIFRETTCLTTTTPSLYVWEKHWQGDAAFTYATLPAGMGDPQLRQRAVAAIESAALTALNYASKNAFNLTTSDPGKPMINGFFSSPHAVDLVRAHFLTQKPEYLAGAVQACLFSGGANPSLLTYTSGLGVRSVVPFKIDYRRTGQPIPEGLTVYGNADIVGFNQSFYTWPIQWHISRVAVPNAYEWPLTEMLFETYLYPGTLEYTVDVWTPNVTVWGYLAARP